MPPRPKKPKVLIVGAGLGGLTLAILLERAGITYELYERSQVSRSLGSATSLTPNVQALFEQLGLLNGLEYISKVIATTNLYKENLEPISEGTMLESVDRWGYSLRIMARPDLHKLLLEQVPPEKIFRGKRVLSMEQSKEGVMIRTSDGKFHHGDILVGADGAYSAVRQSLYRHMKDERVLPPPDRKPLKVCHMSFLGTTTPLNPRQFPALRAEASLYDSVIGHKRPETWRYFTIPGNRVCWRVDIQLESTNYNDNDTFKNSEWGPESCETLPSEWNNFKLPMGGTMGQLIDATPVEARSKVVLEEKVFESWFHKRTVLIGDACHKLLPNAGRGAVNAMLDAVVLANALYEYNSAALPDVKAAFQEYYDERYPTMTKELANSQQRARVMAGQTWKDALTRKIAMEYMPKSIQIKIYEKELLFRPQASFLPQVPNRGILKVAPQKPSKRYQETLANMQPTVV